MRGRDVGLEFKNERSGLPERLLVEPATVVQVESAAFEGLERAGACYQLIRPSSFSPSGVSVAVAAFFFSQSRGSPGKHRAWGWSSSRQSRMRSCALGFVVPVGRIHRDVLRHAHAVLGMVGPHAVGEQRLKIRRSPASISTLTILRPVGVGVHRVAIGGLGLHPLVEILEELGNALEAADLAVLLLQAEHALHADRQRVAARCRRPSG